jgi:hypothetical protein
LKARRHADVVKKLVARCANVVLPVPPCLQTRVRHGTDGGRTSYAFANGNGPCGADDPPPILVTASSKSRMRGRLTVTMARIAFVSGWSGHCSNVARCRDANPTKFEPSDLGPAW